MTENWESSCSMVAESKWASHYRICFFLSCLSERKKGFCCQKYPPDLSNAHLRHVWLASLFKHTNLVPIWPQYNLHCLSDVSLLFSSLLFSSLLFSSLLWIQSWQSNLLLHCGFVFFGTCWWLEHKHFHSALLFELCFHCSGKMHISLLCGLLPAALVYSDNL